MSSEATTRKRRVGTAAITLFWIGLYFGNVLGPWSLALMAIYPLAGLCFWLRGIR